MSRRTAALGVAVVALLPRLIVVFVERDQLIAGLTEKSDRFARTLVETGTFGFIAGVPSAYTQPLYTLFLAPLYWAFDRSWLTIGLAQAILATGTALFVLAIGERVISRRVGVVAAVLATLHPYLVWHDVHINREVLDGFLAAALTYLVVVATDRASIRFAAAAGLTAGLAILGNTRLALLPFALAVYLVCTAVDRRAAVASGVMLVIAAGVAVSPWVIRNKISVGCLTITTDARALWKANNLHTYEILSNGGWIDQVPPLPGAPPWPELAADRTLSGHPTPIDDCAQMRLYSGEVRRFWIHHPAEKARLSAQAVRMLWSPVVTVERTEPSNNVSWLLRKVVEPAYMVILYGLAVIGLFGLPRRYLALTLLLLGYGTAMAIVFVGTVRYRVPWDFLLCLPAAVALTRAWAMLLPNTVLDDVEG